MGRITFSGIALAALSTVAGSALAEPIEPIVATACDDAPHTCAFAPLVFDQTDALPVEWNFDTGWVPPGSPLQVHIQSLVAAHTTIHLEGALFTDWLLADYAGELVFDAPGTPDGGLLSYHYGFLFLAEGKVQIDINNNTSINWQGPIPYVPQFDLQVQDDVVFDAWGWDPGVTSKQKTDPQLMAQVDMTSLLGVSIPGLESGFQLDVAVELEVTWINDRIVVERVFDEAIAAVEGGPITEAGMLTFDPVDAGPFAELDVHPEGRTFYTGTLHLIPSFYVKALGNTWSIPIADIPIPFVETEVDWSFVPERVHVPLPDFEVLDETVDFGEVLEGEHLYWGYNLRSKGEAPAYVHITSSDPGAFVAVDEILTIDPGADVTAAVKFVPQHEGLHEGQLVLYSNDPVTPVQVVSLRGMGLDNGETTVPPAPAAIEAEGGCGCTTAPASRSSFGWLFGLGAALLMRRRKKA